MAAVLLFEGLDHRSPGKFREGWFFVPSPWEGEGAGGAKRTAETFLVIVVSS